MLPDTYMLTRPNGEVVELLNFRRQPDLGFVRKPRTRKKLPGSFRSNKRPKLIERDGMDCHYCHQTMQFAVETPGRAQPKNILTIEHIVPQSLGGPNAMENLVLACGKCNNDFGSEYIKCRCSFCNNARSLFGGKI